MSFSQFGIEVKKFGGFLVASRRGNLHNRQDIAEALAVLLEEVPPELVTGPPFWIRHFIHSYPQGLDIEVCLPVKAAAENEPFDVRFLPEIEVLSKTSTGEDEPLAEIYQTLFGISGDHALTSDEFLIEVMHDHKPEKGRIEVLLVLHPWQDLFARYLEDVMGPVVREVVMEGSDTIFLESSTAERFAWTKAAVERLDRVADDFQRYQVLSGCSHVFPATQTAKLRQAYLRAREQGAGYLDAVDAVLGFMEADPGWRQETARDGRVIYATKKPSNPEAYANAATDTEKRRAYCFCPIIRDHLEDGMSPTFCYCSAGFERKQWEAALAQPVRIDVVKSLLKGDDRCQFAIHLPEG